ncbi:agmatinase [Candidatus Nomurabacteria bacterium RIFCSPHIGHO2_01_FULL_37_25]|uniref:Agmatinase n=1 Tax=Candidatus Nomurabacteria bacterium RIFCSPLOWO2_01_FULL_36_16 TaxID=1801767 RepID=A0A1F6WXS1_9BACT|nr:MAG: agmatinase [Candidatus Nomurabacteria bacterium RIFCSPHIGHO2_01_FULL_37_25]OGI74983.1 MAG: agmatinase [Candidatus Nomurabacteria bacterium RIFCSPHIGHO2_02_FULL_36_29]OGI86689.1 MAG: agmatinase [Candidatus Nomurabacteria bacterium RIFCSPLOWO2_01_FULL_36_16]OGI96418.1 MAG: agmatinase [Candidatus Nomurabacteria bacterium RIFCSPLOWO2_02_FULL_36_8]
MTDSIFSAKNINEADVVVVQAGYEKTTSSRKGTKNGPKAIIKMMDSKLELFDRKYNIEPCSKIKIAQKDLGNISSLSPEKALLKITTECGKILDKNKFVFLLGGEHSVSLGLLQALSKKKNPKEVTILHIDAHCDLRDTDADYNDNHTNLAHSCVMRRAHELGYSLVQVGIRTYFKDEYEYFSNPKNNIKVWQWGNGNKIPSIKKILESIKTKYVYISIDVDGFDPAHMPGTGTAVQGGIEWWYGLELIENIIIKKKLIGADIMEVAPMRDSILTEYGAAQLCYSMISHNFKDKFK